MSLQRTTFWRMWTSVWSPCRRGTWTLWTGQQGRSGAELLVWYILLMPRWRTMSLAFTPSAFWSPSSCSLKLVRTKIAHTHTPGSPYHLILTKAEPYGKEKGQMDRGDQEEALGRRKLEARRVDRREKMARPEMPPVPSSGTHPPLIHFSSVFPNPSTFRSLVPAFRRRQFRLWQTRPRAKTYQVMQRFAHSLLCAFKMQFRCYLRC